LSSDQAIHPARYRVIPRTLVFVFRGESLLLIRGAEHKSWAGKYNAIGGHIERGEDALSSARRELLEETGLQADLRLCGTLINDTGQEVGVAVYIFAAECPTGEPQPSSEGTLEWVAFDRLFDLPLRFDDLVQLLPHVLKSYRGGRPFSVCSYYDETGRLLLSFGGA